MTATAAAFTVTMPSKRPIMKNTAVAMLPPSGKAPPFVGRMRRPVGRPPKNGSDIGKRKVGRPSKAKA